MKRITDIQSKEWVLKKFPSWKKWIIEKGFAFSFPLTLFWRQELCGEISKWSCYFLVSHLILMLNFWQIRRNNISAKVRCFCGYIWPWNINILKKKEFISCTHTLKVVKKCICMIVHMCVCAYVHVCVEIHSAKIIFNIEIGGFCCTSCT